METQYLEEIIRVISEDIKSCENMKIRYKNHENRWDFFDGQIVAHKRTLFFLGKMPKIK